MSKTLFSKKIEIIGTIYMLFSEQVKDDEEWSAFFEWADVGLPMAYLSHLNLIDIKDDAKHYIDDTWIELCNIISVDAEAEYTSLKEFFDASPNDPLDNDEE